MTLTLALGDQRDALPDTYTIRCARRVSDKLIETPDPGFIEAHLSASNGTPETNPNLHSGRPIVLAWDGRPLGTWTVDRSTITYGYGNKADPEKLRTGVYGIDKTAILAALPGPHTIHTGTIAQRAQEILAGLGLAHEAHTVNLDQLERLLTSTPATEAPPLALAALTEALATVRGRAHFDAAGVLQIYDHTVRPTAPAMTFTDTTYPGRPDDVAYYTDITPAFDSADIINALDITDTTTGLTTNHLEADSVTAWGPQREELKITNDYPERISRWHFATRARPTTRARTIIVNVGENATSPDQIARLELHDLVTVRREGIPTADLIVTGIEHTISATKRATKRNVQWTTILTLRPNEPAAHTWDDVNPARTWDDVDPTLTWANGLLTLP